MTEPNKPIDHRFQSFPSIPEGEEISDQAIHKTSSGGLIGTSIDRFLSFLWILTTPWTKASYGEWKEKKDLSNQLANTMADFLKTKSATTPTPNQIAASQKAFEVHFNAFPLETLKQIETVFKQHPASLFYIAETAVRAPHTLHSLLEALPEEKVQNIFNTLEKTAELLPDSKLLYQLGNDLFFSENVTRNDTFEYRNFLDNIAQKNFDVDQVDRLAKIPEFKGLIELFKKKYPKLKKE